MLLHYKVVKLVAFFVLDIRSMKISIVSDTKYIFPRCYWSRDIGFRSTKKCWQRPSCVLMRIPNSLSCMFTCLRPYLPTALHSGCGVDLFCVGLFPHEHSNLPRLWICLSLCIHPVILTSYVEFVHAFTISSVASRWGISRCYYKLNLLPFDVFEY